MASSGTIRRKRVPAWVSNVAYSEGTVVSVEGLDYEAFQSHLSSAKNKPGTPGGEDVWLRRTGDPGRSYGVPSPWAANVLYAERAMVIYKGSVYTSRSQHTSGPMNAPGVPGAPWNLFAAGGKDGQPGKDGADAKLDVDVLKRIVNEAVDKLPRPKDGDPGRPGAPGEPGRSIKGDPGAPGKDGSGFRWRGYWAPNIRYEVRDVVRVNTDAGGARGGTFLCIVPNQSRKPPAPGWELFTQDGASGPAGGGTGTGSEFTGEIAADHVTLAGHASYPTVQAALDALLYIAPVINSFTNDVGTVELGSSVAATRLSWTLNKVMTTLNLSNGIGDIDPDLDFYDVTGPWTTDQTWTLTAGDGTNTTQRSTSVLFRRKRHWGASALTSLTSSDILALSGSEFATSFNKAITYDCTGGKYPYFAYPSAFGIPAAVTVGGLAFSDFSVDVVSHTNSSGHTENYNVLRFNNLQNGANIQVVWQ